ncbi:MAG: alpha/beta hydrolase [Halobacteriota archaeon]|nr:alpha/beta hydrolase [Halobacteriota archaeon]
MNLEINELEITYRDRVLKISYSLRRGGEATVLYIHGLGCSKDDFLAATEVRELKAHTLLAFDFPGCGNSTYPEDMALEIDDLVEITDIVVSELGLAGFVLIGHSMGGLVALLYAEKYAEKVKAFINVEGNLGSENSTISRKVAKISFEEFNERVFPNLKERLLAMDNTGFKRHVEILKRYSSPKAFFDYSPSLMEYSDSGKLIQRFTGLKIPKLFVYGSENSTLSFISELKEAGCEVAEISGSNHFPNYDNPEEYYDVVSKFLERVLE